MHKTDRLRSSDPDEVTLVLVNMASQPTVNKVITQNAKVSDGSYTVDMITGIPVAYVVSLTRGGTAARLIRSTIVMATN